MKGGCNCTMKGTRGARGGVLRMRDQGFHAKTVPPDEKNSSWAIFFEFGKSNMPNSRRWALFLLPILFWELANNKICQTKNSKLLEMLPNSSVLRFGLTEWPGTWCEKSFQDSRTFGYKSTRNGWS
jgi:hypothetical protein